MAIDLESAGQAVGATLLAVGAVASGVWNFVLKNKVAIAKTKVEVAKSDASRAVENANHSIVSLLTERLTAVERDVQSLRAELAVERNLVRSKDSYIWILIKILRDQSIEFPAFDSSSYKDHS